MNCYFKPLSYVPILGSSNSAANKDVINITKWGKIIRLSRKHCGKKGEIACYEQFLLFPQCFQNCLLLMRIHGAKG